MKKMPVSVYKLNGSNDEQNINRRVNLLTALLDIAAKKGNDVGEYRQKNMNYALIIFAGLFTFNMKFSFPNQLYSIFISIALSGIMIVFCLLDRKTHTYIHGWRKTEKQFMEKVNDVINNPEGDISYYRYMKEGEKTAEYLSRQPIVYYLLIISAVLNLIYCIKHF